MKEGRPCCVQRVNALTLSGQWGVGVGREAGATGGPVPRSRAHVPARSHVGAGCWCWFPSTPHALLPGAWATLSLPPRAGAMGPGVSGLGVFIQLHRGPSEPLHSLACRRSQRRDVYKSVSGVNETRRDVSHLLRVRHVLGPACPRCWHTPAQRPEGQGRLLMWGTRGRGHSGRATCHQPLGRERQPLRLTKAPSLCGPCFPGLVTFMPRQGRVLALG